MVELIMSQTSVVTILMDLWLSMSMTAQEELATRAHLLKICINCILTSWNYNNNAVRINCCAESFWKFDRLSLDLTPEVWQCLSNLEDISLQLTVLSMRSWVWGFILCWKPSTVFKRKSRSALDLTVRVLWFRDLLSVAGKLWLNFTNKLTASILTILFLSIKKKCQVLSTTSAMWRQRGSNVKACASRCSETLILTSGLQFRTVVSFWTWLSWDPTSTFL